MSLDELIERLEKATGPDRELDAWIKALVYAPEGATVEQSKINGAWCVYHGTDRHGQPRLFERPRHVSHEQWSGHYTSSIDAALTLVPQTGDQGLRYRIVMEQKPTHDANGCWFVMIREHAKDGWDSMSTAGLPIAICQAALRARKASQ